MKQFIAALTLILLVEVPIAYGDDRYIMIVNNDLKAMIYKRGLITNKWKPYKVDGFAIGGQTISFEEFAEQYFVEEKNELWTIDDHLGTKTNRLCRMSPRSTYEGERLQFYVGDGNSRRYLVFDDREDYLQFRCKEQ
jgi:hypothetical protein